MYFLILLRKSKEWATTIHSSSHVRHGGFEEAWRQWRNFFEKLKAAIQPYCCTSYINNCQRGNGSHIHRQHALRQRDNFYFQISRLFNFQSSSSRQLMSCSWFSSTASIPSLLSTYFNVSFLSSACSIWPCTAGVADRCARVIAVLCMQRWICRPSSVALICI